MIAVVERHCVVVAMIMSKGGATHAGRLAMVRTRDEEQFYSNRFGPSRVFTTKL